ncbi:MAG: GNAT family N-acetyltransferase [Clostridia bacterium]
MQIRAYKSSDKPQLRQICVDTTHIELNQRSKQYLPILWNDYYTERESQNIFVLDDNGLAVGYVLCSTNTNFYKVFKSDYLPKVRKISPKMCFLFKLGHLFEAKYLKKYIAHLHIDILPTYQRGGYGKLLVDALAKHLLSKNIHSVMLVCDKNNKQGINFYLKYGFKQKANILSGIVFVYNF